VAVARIDLICGWQVFLRVRLCDLAGPAYLMAKDTDVFYGLHTMDLVRVRAQLFVNGVQFRPLNWLASNILMADTVRRKLVFPAMKSHFVVRPEVLKEFFSLAKAAA
jgi:hypothetical protein